MKKQLAEVFLKENCPDLYDVMKPGVEDRPHYILNDMAAKLVKYGSLSVKQIDFARKLVREAAERAKQKAEQAANAKPVIEGTVAVTGTVLCTKVKENQYGLQYKMLVLDDRGFKVWGTNPVALDAAKGDKVSFVATIEKSPDDECFGFFKRPRKAELLQKAG